ncbi:MAG: transporter substrate-binding domain-containing protein [Fibromonadaceae bacterium]|jgi:signal transduction histidine kinase/CheY-like chemotaxis protein/HPt (histidine-containing phosphotransfer) domain-containing protein|nr:transporter substrate-binding domain-containing protein [Fibromonadaceae bacterium]
MNKIKACILFMAILLLAMLSACIESEKRSHKPSTFSSFREIPGVTAEEIAAIEALQQKSGSFVYGMMPSTEAFINRGGEIRGFTALFCDWLTELFGIPFKPQLFTWADLFEGLENSSIDFVGNLTATDERRKTFLMTDAITQRSVKAFQIVGSEHLSEIAQTHLPRYALLSGTTTVDAVLAYAGGTFEPVYVSEYVEAYELLKAGKIDALVAENANETVFDAYGDIVARDFYPLIYSPVSLTTNNQALAPIISVVQKALDNNAIYHLNELHSQGYREYMKHKLFMRLTEEEIEYIKKHPVVPFAAESHNYPISFFNTRHKEWQGISFDVLQEIEALTGLEFVVANKPNVDFPELFRLLESGDMLMVSELVRSRDREGRFLWPSTPFLIDNTALISKTEHRDINAHEVLSVKVGLTKNSAHSMLFNKWFQDHKKTVEYNSKEEALGALIDGEVDMIITSAVTLLWLTNFLELPGYKTNIVFNSVYESAFGFNKDAGVLLSIVNKALELIDTEAISGRWLRKTYDYRVKLAQAQTPWMIALAATLAMLLIIITVIYVRDKRKNKTIIDGLRRAEVAEESNKAKSRFLAMMSHEIRTPMNSIVGFAELALDSESRPQVDDYLKKITDSTRWLLRIINDILDISRIEAGKMELDYVPFGLHEVFSRCQSVVLPSIKDKGLDLSISAEPSIGKKLIGDPVRLYQILMNLLSNAVKFTDTGTIKFTSAIKSSNDAHTTVYFEVKDTGIGISSEQIKKIFNPFTQADSSTTRNYEGTGLGLAIVKNIVELMDGKLAVESSPGAGSTFSFEITFNTIDVPNEISQKSFDIVERPYFNGLVLICDDNSLNQQVICAHLARVGLQTMAAENGKIGVEMVRERKSKNEKPFDLILMDMFMPVMDGMEAAAKIIAMNTGAPVVAMTANVMVNELEEYKRNGMPDCLGKPFTTQELWQLLLKYLKPVSTELLCGNIDDDDMEQQKIMQLNFYKSNQAVHTEIAEAAAAGDTKLAHRLAHTLKGSAGLLGKTDLRNAASEVEALLRDGTASVWDNRMNVLKTELMRALEEYKPLLNKISKQERPVLDTEQTLALFEKLGPMLEKVNPECVDLLDSIRAVPGAEELAQQIENYNFKAAAKTLAELKNKVGEHHE